METSKTPFTGFKSQGLDGREMSLAVISGSSGTIADRFSGNMVSEMLLHMQADP